MLSDIKYAFRRLIKSPGFTIFVVLTLALGIGANTAIFTVINSVLLSSLPVKNPQQLVFLSNPDNHGMSTGSETGQRRDHFTYSEFLDLNARDEAFSGVLAVGSYTFSLSASLEEGGPSLGQGSARVSMVSGNYFSVLGANAVLGRTFTSDVDKVRNANPVAVIGYRYWQETFGGDPAIIGKKLRIRHTIFDIIGIGPRGFAGETVGMPVDVWIPLSMEPKVFPGHDWLSQETNPYSKTMWLELIGRLKPGVDLARAKAATGVTFRQYLENQEAAVPVSHQRDFLDQPLELVDGSRGASTLRQGYGEPLVIIMVLVGLLLLTACVNVANLLLARAASRQKEIAVRVAIGATPGRIFRQLLAESILLSLLGGVLGILLAKWGDALLLQMFSLQGNLSLSLDGPVLFFTLGVSLLVGILFGTAPALQSARLDLNSAIKGGLGKGRVALDRALVVAQVAFSLLLLIAAGLFVDSFKKLTTADLGYDRDHLLTVNFGDAADRGFKAPAIGPLYERLIERMRAIPGVRGVSYSSATLLGPSEVTLGLTIRGMNLTTAQKDYTENHGINVEEVGPNYFSTVGIPVPFGREIKPEDGGNGQRVGVINRSMARYYFGDENPIGRLIILTANNDFLAASNASFMVVGVANDAKYHQVREDASPRCYIPFENPVWASTGVTFQVRAVGNPAALSSAIRAAIKEVASSLPAAQVQTMNQRAEAQLGSDRMLAKLAGFFGVMAAVFASIGIYGMLSYIVVRRTREIGIRTALGAPRGNILWLILGDSLVLVLLGVAIGVPATILSGKLITSLLYGLSPANPSVIAVAVILMFGVGAIAGYIPAYRASRINPLIALRAE